MINKNNFRALLKHLNFDENADVFKKQFDTNNSYLEVDFRNEKNNSSSSKISPKRISIKNRKTGIKNF